MGMVLTVEDFIGLYKKLKKGGSKNISKKQLKEYEISEEQLLSYANFIDDLELNEDGIRVMFKEIQNGHLKL